MNLKCKINGIEYKNIVQGLNYSEEYNETLDSASIILSDMPKIDLVPYDDFYIYDGTFNGYDDGYIGEDKKFYSSNEYYKLPNFFLHLLVDQFTEEMINPCDDPSLIRYKYKIDLMSETKKLETIQLPNFSITQPLDIAKKKSVWQYLIDIVDLYSPLYKKVRDDYFKVWSYEKKYKIDENLKKTFENVYAPDFTLNNPNLRDVLAQLMKTKDMIPVVRNDIITGMDISETTGNFVVDTRHITNIIGSRSSDNHCDNLKRTYNNALSQDNTCRMVEFLGFRNSNSGLLTLENLKIETRFPIYKINKVHICYYKKIYLADENGQVTPEYRIFLCKQDITKLIKLNSERNLLSEDWVEYEKNAHSGMTLDELSKYKIATIGYDIGSKYIDGWGTKYSYINAGIFDMTKTYIENILLEMDKKFPYGIYNYGYIVDKGNLPENYGIVGAGEFDFKDTIINVFKNDSNLALFFKSLFFEIDYNAFYNGTVMHSKDVYRDDIVINDNSSSSLTLLEQDGIFQKEKANRFGNKTIKIHAIYDSFDQVQPLGSIYNYGGDTDVIIYHREVSINNNVITCVYYGAQDYVLKNYYTSVNAKLRPFNLLSYEESVRRSENKRMYILASKECCYYEKESKILNIDHSFIEKFLSFYKDTVLGSTKGNFIFNDKINYGYFTYGNKKFASDINAFSSGYSMCFNLAMYDNVSGGIYIDKDYLEPQMLNVNDDYMKGSVQRWYITSDEETGFAENMGFYVGHVDLNNIFYDKNVLEMDEKENVETIIKENILSLPKINVTDENFSMIIGNNFKINKDNKELIDMTYQFELISDNEDVLFSPWTLRLSELLGNYIKFSKDKKTYDFDAESVSYRAISSTAYTSISDETVNLKTRHPIMLIQVEKEYLERIKNGRFKAKFVFDVDKSSGSGGDWRLKNPIYYSFEPETVYRAGEEQLYLTGKQTVITDGGFLGNGTFEYNDDGISFLFKRVYKIGNTDAPDNMAWFSNCSVDVIESPSGENVFRVQYFGANGETYYDGENNHMFFNGTQITFSSKNVFEPDEVFDESNYDYLKFNFSKGDGDETLYNRNIIAVLTANKMKKSMVYDEYPTYENMIQNIQGLVFDDLTPNKFLSIAEDEKNGHSILRVNLKRLKDYGGADLTWVRSLQIWYKDELSYKNNTNGLITVGEKGYHFVFGVNINEEDYEKDYINIHLSLLSRKDKRIFDDGHNLIGYIRNEANTDEPLYNQYYEDIS